MFLTPQVSLWRFFSRYLIDTRKEFMMQSDVQLSIEMNDSVSHNPALRSWIAQSVAAMDRILPYGWRVNNMYLL